VPVHGKSNLLELATGLGNHPETIQSGSLQRERRGRDRRRGEGGAGRTGLLFSDKKAIYI
jgi:hypothetical protein